tara:strand:+ start:1932 stop:2564 length:633 start_codon:yes stop_codon:yes gene_type:complete
MEASGPYSEDLLDIFTQGILDYKNLSAEQISSKIGEKLIGSNFTPIDIDLGYRMEAHDFNRFLLQAIKSLDGVPKNKLANRVIKSLQSCGLDFVDKSVPNYIPQTQSKLIDDMLNAKMKIDNVEVFLRYMQGDDKPLLLAKEHIERLSNEFEKLRFNCLDVNYVPTVTHQELSANINGLVNKATEVIDRIDNDLQLSKLADPSSHSLKPN